MAARNLLLLIGGLVMLALTSPKLTLLVLAGVPLVVLPIILFGRRVRRLARATQDRVGDVGAYLDEALHEIRTVQAYGHEDVDRVRFGERVEAAFATARAAGPPARAAGRRGDPARVRRDRHHPLDRRSRRRRGAAVAAARCRRSCSTPSSSPARSGTLSEVFGDLQRAAGATERLFELLATEAADSRAAASGPAADAAARHGRVRGVSFRYPSRPDAPALDDLSLAVAPGENVALVGPSGAGKTTVFQLLLRFYDPQAGGVRVDGVDVRAADPADVRAPDRAGAAGPGDLRRVGAGKRPLRPARGERRRGPRGLRGRAAPTSSSTRLPEGYASFLGERGVRLSGGQRQRLAIARAILADRPILLLDEATSALDAESERAGPAGAASA